ncbi:hypothetical protein L6164_031608 [Bauhinia variegata]|uniref:Uncharacterized protein n=1 Tax=Bauhinia variegata TaxID=167791 RepID=A0ACB9LHH9_BAUVA|nr:hypothetical protein L6164_031608 [Bauhinia variegata]
MKPLKPNSPTLCHVYHQILLLFSLSFIFLLPIPAARALTNETEKMALLKFKESITNDPHGILGSWNGSTHFCNWVGVRCGRKHQRVTALELNGYGFGGLISPYIGNLSFIRSIMLCNNSLSGHIPLEIGRLFRLQDFLLWNNTLGGEVPRSLVNCSQLRILDLTTNHLTGPIPIEFGCLMKLEELYLGINILTGGLPPTLGNISSLVALSVAGNSLEGLIPYEIGCLKKLSKFEIGVNNLSGAIPSSLYNISSMTILSATQNQLGGTLPDNIGTAMWNLQVLELGFNKLSGSVPPSLCNISGLQSVDLGDNNFVGSVPTNFGKLRQLSFLGLWNNHLGHNSWKDWDFLNSLTNCSKLEFFDLACNNVGGILPMAIGNLSNQLSYLFLESNKIHGSIPAEITSLRNLIFLDLENNSFTGTIPTSFGQFRKLQVLILRQNKLSGHIPSSIGNLTRLINLYFDENRLEGSIPEDFENCQNLQKLLISHNNLNGAIPKKIFRISSLIWLNLSHNSLAGRLPHERGNLKNIYSLDLSENVLFGDIPTAIGDCLSLEYLFLQGNFFQGGLPASLASLRGIRILDLSRNNLSGEIPKDLQILSDSSYLNFSFNKLQGEVPTGGVFKNASAISLTGNGFLCGGVPELHLPLCPTGESKRVKKHVLKLRILVICLVLFFFLLAASFTMFWIRKSKRKTSTFSTIDGLLQVSYRRILEATGGLSPNNLIGVGSFGSVYKGTIDSEERVVAVKVLNLQQKEATKSFLAECNALKRIKHRNLVKVLTCCSSIDYNGNDFKALVFEFMTNGSLEKWIHPEQGENQSLDFLHRLNVSMDVASALQYLHHECEQPVVHCDLKPSNVLLDSDLVAHLSDFGLARLLLTPNQVSESKSSTIGLKGSVGYAAPEYGIGGKASKEGDVYSFGILLLEMFTGRRPTEEMFMDDFNLHSYVNVALPEKLLQVIDPILAQEGTAEQNGETSSYQTNIKRCILSVLEVGLTCSKESPEERMKIGDAIRQLQMIKRAAFLLE